MSRLKFIFCCFTEDPPAGGTDVDLQLLEASKAGDMEVVKVIYRFLSVTSRINCIVARCLINVVYLTACCLYQVMITLHFLNDVANDAESTYKSKMTS